MSGGHRRALALAGGGALMAATVLLWTVSRGKWSDPLIDSGREWIVPDALSRGALLYRDVVYWFGPFTPYFHAAFFHLFGSNYQSLVAAGALAAIGALVALFLLLLRVTGRVEALLGCALAVPALVFMPHAGGALLGMGYRIWHSAVFALFAVWVASGPRRGGRVFFLAGALAGLAGLCRTEWGAVSLAAILLTAFLRGPVLRRSGGEAAAAVAGYVLFFGGVLAAFLSAAGPRAVLEEGHLLFSRLPEETRRFLVEFSHVRDWRRGLPEMLYSGALWAGLFLVVETLAERGDPGRRRVRIGALALLFVVLVVLAAVGGASGAVVWSAAPVVSAVALAVGLLRRGSPRSAALAACGLLGLLLSYRRPFHIGDLPYVAPPLLFLFVSAAGLLRLRISSRSPKLLRLRLRRALVLMLLLLVGAAFAARLEHYLAWEGEPIAGTGGLLTARPRVAREIEGVARTVRAATAPGGTLVVFPEGELLNLLSGRNNPIRHKLYLPGYLTEENEGEIVGELERALPSAVVLWLRPTSEYGRERFGLDFGLRVRRWLEENYELVPYRMIGPMPLAETRFLYGLPRKARSQKSGS